MRRKPEGLRISSIMPQPLQVLQVPLCKAEVLFPAQFMIKDPNTGPLRGMAVTGKGRCREQYVFRLDCPHSRLDQFRGPVSAQDMVCPHSRINRQCIPELRAVLVRILFQAGIPSCRPGDQGGQVLFHGCGNAQRIDIYGKIILYVFIMINFPAVFKSLCAVRHFSCPADISKI